MMEAKIIYDTAQSTHLMYNTSDEQNIDSYIALPLQLQMSLLSPQALSTFFLLLSFFP